MKLGYIVLAHEAPEQLFPLLDCLSTFDDVIALHYDKSSAYYSHLRRLKEKYPKILIVPSVKVKWGEASIIMATLKGMQTIIDSGEKPEYISLISGSCFPIKSRDDLCSYLQKHKGKEFIECHDISVSSWVKDGLEDERWKIFHFCNWRRNPALFTFLHHLQRKLRIRRKFPAGENMYMGSQWWTLSYGMIRQLVEASTRKMLKFIKHCWIPDEFYFQTLVGNLLSPNRVKKNLMYFRFNSKGIPKIFTEIDKEELDQSHSFFARKTLSGKTGFKEWYSNVYVNGAKSEDQPKKNIAINPYRGFAHGRKNYQLDIRDYLLPVVIILDCRKDSLLFQDFFREIKEIYPDFNIFGNILSEKEIDYGLEEPFSLYGKKDIALRDFSIYEFLSYLALSSPMGFCFHLNSHSLPQSIDELKEMPNLALIDLWDEELENLENIKSSYKLENYVASYSCQFKRLFTVEKENLLNLLEDIFNSNIYLRKTLNKGIMT